LAFFQENNWRNFPFLGLAEGFLNFNLLAFRFPRKGVKFGFQFTKGYWRLQKGRAKSERVPIRNQKLGFHGVLAIYSHFWDISVLISSFKLGSKGN